MITRRTQLVLDYVDFYPVTLDFEHSQVVAIYGKKEFGKTNLLRLLMNGLCDKKPDARVVFLDDGRNQLKPIYESINTQLDSVMIHQYEQVELCSISSAYLLDNIAEFAGERGQKTIFGSMDVKSLKEDYARCEKGDGYYYDVEADRLMKLKFIKTEE